MNKNIISDLINNMIRNGLDRVFHLFGFLPGYLAYIVWIGFLVLLILGSIFRITKK